MGNQTQCLSHDCEPCSGEKAAETFKLEKEESMKPTDQVCIALGSSMDGFWYEKNSGKHMGEVIENYLYWNAAWGSLEPSLLQRPKPDVIEVAINGGSYRGVVNFEAQGRIEWDDGSVWLRK
mmetsp:Transcript_13818/g.25897  ORF Transcript_13818/g.25897 Transcript_13818/m.25897 type:complete len:122 (-) Transcript_13818:171-536(-)